MKKNHIVIAVIALVVIGGLFLNKNKAAKNGTTTPTSTSQTNSVQSSSISQPATSSSKVEDAYVELLAQTTYHAQKNDQSGWTAQNEQTLFTKYGVTKEEVDAFSKGLRNNPVQAKAVTIKQLRRLQELQKEGN